MGRKGRINLFSMVYYISCKGNSRENLFLSEPDKNLFISYLDKYSKQFNFLIHAYCLLEDEIHLLVESRNDNLSEFMRALLTSYTVSFHRRHKTSGHLFADRFKSFIVEKNPYLLDVSRMIHNLPVKNCMVKKPENYKWSSFEAYLNPHLLQSFLYTQFILSWFNGHHSDYKKFVYEGLNKKGPEILNNLFIGSHSFVKKIKSLVRESEGVNYLLPGEKIIQKQKKRWEQGSIYANNLLTHICKNFKCDPRDVQNKRKRLGRLHYALIIMIYLLRQNTEWTFLQIANYFNISIVHAQNLYHHAEKNYEILVNKYDLEIFKNEISQINVENIS